MLHPKDYDIDALEKATGEFNEATPDQEGHERTSPEQRKEPCHLVRFSPPLFSQSFELAKFQEQLMAEDSAGGHRGRTRNQTRRMLKLDSRSVMTVRKYKETKTLEEIYLEDKSYVSRVRTHSKTGSTSKGRLKQRTYVAFRDVKKFYRLVQTSEEPTSTMRGRQRSTQWVRLGKHAMLIERRETMVETMLDLHLKKKSVIRRRSCRRRCAYLWKRPMCLSDGHGSCSTICDSHWARMISRSLFSKIRHLYMKGSKDMKCRNNSSREKVQRCLDSMGLTLSFALAESNSSTGGPWGFRDPGLDPVWKCTVWHSWAAACERSAAFNLIRNIRGFFVLMSLTSLTTESRNEVFAGPTFACISKADTPLSLVGIFSSLLRMPKKC